MKQVYRGARECPPHRAADGYDTRIRAVLVERATGDLRDESKAGANTGANEDPVENGVMRPVPNDDNIILAVAPFPITRLNGQRRTIELRDAALRCGAARVNDDDTIAGPNEELQIPEGRGNGLGGRKHSVTDREQQAKRRDTSESSHNLSSVAPT
jgi:hypothetical protein